MSIDAIAVRVVEMLFYTPALRDKALRSQVAERLLRLWEGLRHDLCWG